MGVAEGLAEKAATAGMWSGQTDEDELGVDYDTLDAILAVHVDGGIPTGATAQLLGVDTETVEHVTDMVAASEHKRQYPPTPAE
jgi:NAD+ synthase